MNDGAIQRKYGVETTILITVYEVDGVNLRHQYRNRQRFYLLDSTDCYRNASSSA